MLPIQYISSERLSDASLGFPRQVKSVDIKPQWGRDLHPARNQPPITPFPLLTMGPHPHPNLASVKEPDLKGCLLPFYKPL